MLKPYKKEYDYSYTLGVFPTLELLRFRPGDVQRVLVSTRGARNEGVRKIETLCSERGIAFEVNDKAVERLSPKENAYAIGVFSKYSHPLDPGGDHLVLVNPGDMGNLGTIIRTMLGFGLANLALVRPAVDIFDPRAVRASMGALFQLSFDYFDTFDAYRSAFAAHHLYPFMTNAALDLREVRFEQPYALVFGNESSGLPDDYLDMGTSVRIHHTGKIDSLNLTIAVGIALYEAGKG